MFCKFIVIFVKFLAGYSCKFFLSFLHVFYPKNYYWFYIFGYSLCNVLRCQNKWLQASLELFQYFQEVLCAWCVLRTIHLKINTEKLAIRRNSYEINIIGLTSEICRVLSRSLSSKRDPRIPIRILISILSPPSWDIPGF